MIDAARLIRTVTYKPGWTFRIGGPLNRFVCVFATTTDSTNHAAQRCTQHMFEYPTDVDDRGFVRWLLGRLLDVEYHEAAEFLRVDGVAPFWPNHEEGSPYERVERWET